MCVTKLINIIHRHVIVIFIMSYHMQIFDCNIYILMLAKNCLRGSSHWEIGVGLKAWVTPEVVFPKHRVATQNEEEAGVPAGSIHNNDGYTLAPAPPHSSSQFPNCCCSWDLQPFVT